jgi:hypothetical protein
MRLVVDNVPSNPALHLLKSKEDPEATAALTEVKSHIFTAAVKQLENSSRARLPDEKMALRENHFSSFLCD